MNVLFAPVFRENPYQNSLKLHLETLGAKVTFISDNLLRTFLQRALKYPKFEVLHLHWTHGYVLDASFFFSLLKSLVFLCSLVLLKIRGTRIIWTVHNLYGHERHHVKFEKWLNRRLLMLCDQIIVHSDYCRDEAIRYWEDTSPQKYHVIPHGNYIDVYPNLIEKERAREVLGIPQDKKVFLFFGLIRGYKGVENLIKVFSAEELKESVLLIVGRPVTTDIKNTLENLLSGRKNIRPFFEYIPEEKIQYFMNASDAVVFSFTDIFTSGSVILAMSFKKAVIVPRHPALHSLIKSGGMKTYSPDDLSEIISLVEGLNQKELDSLGRKNFLTAKGLDWIEIAEKTLEIYNI